MLEHWTRESHKAEYKAFETVFEGYKGKRTREELEAELRASEERFRTFMNQSPFLAFIKDEGGRFVFYNERMAERFQITTSEWLGKHDFEIWPEETARQMHQNDLAVIASHGSVDGLEQTTDAHGHKTTWKVHKFAWKNEQGQTFIGGIGVDMSQDLAREKALAELNQRLERLAALDSLTGLANRRVLDERIEYDFRIARRNKAPLSVVLLDLDNFKRRNDLFGHAAGDEVLRRLGTLVLEKLRVTDLAGRYGGEEIVVILPGANGGGARIYAERLRAAMRMEVWPHEPVTASFGIATLESDTQSGRHLIALADWAMYEAKRAGKDRIVESRDVPGGARPLSPESLSSEPS